MMPFRANFMASALSAAILLCASGATFAQSTDFTFDTMPLGLSSPLIMTQNGITATFTDDLGLPHAGGGPSDDGQFAIDSSSDGLYSSAFSGNVLSAAAGYAGGGHSLVILFSQPISTISFNFALTQQYVTPATLTFLAYNGTIPMATESPLATPSQFGWFPEGVINYSSSQTFDKIELSIDQGSYFGLPPALVVDNILVTDPAPVPEASTLLSLGLLLTLGLGGCAVSVRRRNVQITE